MTYMSLNIDTPCRWLWTVVDACRSTFTFKYYRKLLVTKLF